MQRDRYPRLNIAPFANVSSLASILSISQNELQHLVGNVNKFYRPGKVLKKKNGESRVTHDAEVNLKQVHEKIKNRILKKIDYPYYLLGGISDHDNPRSCKGHASIHCGKKILISEDIANFFPSTSCSVVKSIWKNCLHCTDNISEMLTKLTTYNGELPQGWKTSGYLANLALWKHEPKLVKELEEKGLFYSRYIDDITVSSPYFIDRKRKSFIVSSIYTMLSLCGYSPKREKHDIASSGRNMRVTSLNVNAKKPTISKPERNNIRAMVFKMEKCYPSQGRTVTYFTDWISLYGKVNRIKSFHKNEGEGLKSRMKKVRPPKHLFQKKS